VNGQGAATSTGFFPAQAEPAEEVHGADHALRASATSTAGSLLTQPVRSPETREEARAERRRSPLKTRRTIYRTSLAPHRKVKSAGDCAPPETAGHTDPSSNL
jgi:hypothetical protein